MAYARDRNIPGMDNEELEATIYAVEIFTENTDPEKWPTIYEEANRDLVALYEEQLRRMDIQIQTIVTVPADLQKLIQDDEERLHRRRADA